MITNVRHAALAVATVAALGFGSAGAASASPACARGMAHAHADAYHGHAHGYSNGHVRNRRHACGHHGVRHHDAHHGQRAHGVRVTYGVPVVPRYYVNQGPALTGPGVLVAGLTYIDAPVAPGYPYIRSYDGGPYAKNATAHYHERRHARRARPAGPGVERADAVIRTIGPNRVDIELYRKD